MNFVSVLITNKSQKDAGILTNAAFVLGLTAGRMLPFNTFGDDVLDGDGSKHTFLTKIPHFVRKAGDSKIRNLRKTFEGHPDVKILVDYTEDAAPSDYDAYRESLRSHSDEAISYRALYVFGPEEVVVPLTKNLSKLSTNGEHGR